MIDRYLRARDRVSDATDPRHEGTIEEVRVVLRVRWDNGFWSEVPAHSVHRVTTEEATRAELCPRCWIRYLPARGQCICSK